MPPLRDRVLDALRLVFGSEREERRDAESPSAAALAAQPSSMFSIYGRDDLGGLLSVSQILMDKFADYEAMEEYPDIGCLAEGTNVYVFDNGIVKPVPIETVAVEGEGVWILGFDTKRKKIVTIQANNPRLTAQDADVVSVKMSNGRTIKATPDHLFLTADGWAAADPSKVKDGVKVAKLVKGAVLIGMFAGFNATGMTALVEPRWGKLELLEDPAPAGKAKVYDITTDTHNFIAEGACVHNSAYRYFANDAVQPSITDGRVIWTVSDDEAIKNISDDLLHKKLRSEYELWSQAYTLDMYGNNYEELLVTENGVVGLNHLPVPTMRRVEGLDGSLIGYVQDITGQFTANSHELRSMLAGNVEIPKSLALFEDWQVAHFRLRATRRRSPYGVGVAEGARWVWKRLIMLEDAATIYRLNRIPRYAFYVDVTDVPPDRVEGFLKKMKRDLKKRKMVNPATGRLDMRYKPLSQDEDFIIGVREGRDLARVEILSAPDWQTIEDIDYFKRMLHGTLNVPRAWLGQDEPIQGKGVLSNEDVRAARVTLNLQQELKLGYERICRVHLAARGIKNPYAPEFAIQMTIPSGIYELAAYEVLNARADYASRIAPFTSVRWIQENIFKWGEAEIEAINKQRKKEQEEGLSMMGGAAGGAPGGPPAPFPPPPAAGPEALGHAQTGQQTPEPPAPNAPAREWQAYDNGRRLEEHLYTQSRRNHQQLMDRLGKVLENQDDAFTIQHRERQEFLNVFKKNALTTSRGHITATPSGRGRQHSPGATNGARVH